MELLDFLRVFSKKYTLLFFTVTSIVYINIIVSQIFYFFLLIDVFIFKKYYFKIRSQIAEVQTE